LELVAMSHEVIQAPTRPRAFQGRDAASSAGRPLPIGFGLLIAAGISAGLWVGIIQLGARLLG
jgi:hypothetical protein